MRKGTETKHAITKEAMAVASQLGLEGLTIGSLAKAVGMSKSGLFAHFSSKEALQLDVLREATDLFTQQYLLPALKLPRGEPRLRAIFEGWLKWVNSKYMPGGCILMAASLELDDRPGPTRDFIVGQQTQWKQFVSKAARMAVEEGHFRKGLDPDQFTFEVFSLFFGYHHFHRLLKDPKAERRLRTAFEELLTRSH